MRPTGPSIALWVVIGLVSSISAPSRASELEDKARAHFETAEAHYEARRFPEALVEYKEAYALLPKPGFLFNIAQCHRNLGDAEQAISFFKAYLERKPDAPDRVSVERLIEELRTSPPPPPEPVLEPTATSTPASVGSGPPAEATIMETEPAPPVYRTAWFWGAVLGGAALVGAAVAIGVASSASDPEGTLGVIDLRP